MKLFAGNANPGLANKVADYLGISLGSLTCKHFADGEIQVMLVTGVMGPETQVYYSSGQLLGLSKGLKGVYDLETMMESGVRIKDKDYPPFTGKTNLGRGSIYYPTLHFALALLILAVVVGNVGMAMAKRRQA